MSGWWYECAKWTERRGNDGAMPVAGGLTLRWIGTGRRRVRRRTADASAPPPTPGPVHVNNRNNRDPPVAGGTGCAPLAFRYGADAINGRRAISRTKRQIINVPSNDRMHLSSLHRRRRVLAATRGRRLLYRRNRCNRRSHTDCAPVPPYGDATGTGRPGARR